MAPSARLIFILLLVCNCILWSSSRYGRLERTSFIHGDNSLVRRIASDLTAPYETSLVEKQCRPKLVPTAEQCSHTRARCPRPETFLSIHYLQWYFCTEIALRPAVFVALLVWLIFLFSTLGISASDFFTPNLATIAKLLGLDDNVAGVTFLAFGNGSPDVFSTFSAMRAESGSLAIGELLGAASFIVSCVVGSMCIIKPFEVHKGPFLRDVGFFTVAVSLLLVILWDGKINPWEAGIMVVLYLIYVGVVVVGSWWERRRLRRKEAEDMARAEYREDDSDFEPYTDDPSPSSSRTATPGLAAPIASRTRAISAPVRPTLQTMDIPPRNSRTPSPPPSASPYSQPNLPSFSLVGALEFREVVASLRRDAASTSLKMFDSPVTPYAGGHYHSRVSSLSRSKSRSYSGEADPWDTSLGLAMNDRSPPPQVHLSPASEDQNDGRSDLGVANGGHGDYLSSAPPSRASSLPSIVVSSSTPSEDGDGDVGFEAESQSYNSTKRGRVLFILAQIFHTLFPSLHRFRSQSLLGQVASLFAAPAIMMLTLTLPVVVTHHEHTRSSHEKHGQNRSEHNLIEFEEEGIERVLVAEEEVQEEMHSLGFNKWLTAAQCICGPLFCVGVLFSGTQRQGWLLLAAGIAGLALAVLVIVSADRGDHPTFRMVRCCMGFLAAVVWIMAIADEVVNVLQTFGFIFGLSDAIIGLTIFAVGNSLADLVANMSVAVFAPIMGFSACFGGPMLNILLGVGISGSYVISQTGQAYLLPFGTTLFVSGIGLLTLLAATLLIVPLNGYRLSRSWGIFLIASYTIIMTINVVVELKS